MANTKQQTDCFHCGLPVPDAVDLCVLINGKTRPMCCPGCVAVAKAITKAGLEDFYDYRSEKSPTGKEIVPAILRQTKIFDNPDIQKTFVSYGNARSREASLILEGIVCAACVWLNEQRIANLPGVLDVSINYANHRARIKWNEDRIHLSDILLAISEIGYLAHPYDPSKAQQLLETERRQYLKQLGVAGVLGMQVMVLAVALYSGKWFGIEPQYQRFFYWLSFGLTLPVIIFSAQPFFKGAWRDLRNRRMGMDVPVVLGISLAFIGSAASTFTGHGQVYFDSVVMFVFFLLVARYFELSARKASIEASSSLVKLQPEIATRINDDQKEIVLAVDLKPGDKILALAGEAIAADGVVLAGSSSVNESLVTGESLPILKNPGQSVIGGSLNCDSPLTIEIEHSSSDTILANLLRLVDRAQSDKPTLNQLAYSIAGWFVAAVLVLAIIVGLYWWQADPGRWLAITIAVLVITCPCALSLATPTAITAATAKLTGIGLLATRTNVLETLARASHVVFDKTGTLTEGNLKLVETKIYAEFDYEFCRKLAASLEAVSEHPIARAFKDATTPNFKTQDSQNSPGSGLRGKIGEVTYYIGTAAYIKQNTNAKLEILDLSQAEEHGNTLILLADSLRVLASFELGDVLRRDAKDLVEHLKQSKKTVWLLTGDHEPAARKIANACGIDHFRYNLRPEQKLQEIKALQQQGAIVVMVGDGINDAPVLAAAHASIAMGTGTQLAAISADMILLSSHLDRIYIGLGTAKKALRIIKQNLAWALVYNICALPLAATGLIAPWVAVIGMSTSSLVVVTNSMRLLR